MRVTAKPLPHGIPPDVAGNILRDLLRPQYVIVITHLPEPLAMSFFEFIGRALFEPIDKLHEIGGVRQTLTEKMNMVGHHAISMQRKIPLRGRFHEMTEQPFAPGPISEKNRAPLGTNGNEIMLATAVVFRGTSQLFCKKRHARKPTTTPQSQRCPAFSAHGLCRGRALARRFSKPSPEMSSPATPSKNSSVNQSLIQPNLQAIRACKQCFASSVA